MDGLEPPTYPLSMGCSFSELHAFHKEGPPWFTRCVEHGFTILAPNPHAGDGSGPGVCFVFLRTYVTFAILKCVRALKCLHHGQFGLAVLTNGQLFLFNNPLVPIHTAISHGVGLNDNGILPCQWERRRLRALVAAIGALHSCFPFFADKGTTCSGNTRPMRIHICKAVRSTAMLTLSAAA